MFCSAEGGIAYMAGEFDSGGGGVAERGSGGATALTEADADREADGEGA